MIAFETPLTSDMQTVEEKGDFPSFKFHAGNERQRRPDEAVRTFGAAYKHYASECIHVFDWRNIRTLSRISIRLTMSCCKKGFNANWSQIGGYINKKKAKDIPLRIIRVRIT